MRLRSLPQAIKPCDIILGAEGRPYTELRQSALLPANRATIILLVHEFNVGQAAAEKSLGTFCDLLEASNPALLSSIRTLSWPGRLTLRPFDYAPALSNAKACASLLAKQILFWYEADEEISPPARLIIFAHSMGCRLVLEALGHIRAAYPEGPFRPRALERLDLVLMAAAVPERMLRSSGNLSDGARVASSIHVLHSKLDAILGAAFPPGQMMAGEFWHGEAVGLRGRPISTPWRHDMTQDFYTHGAYWRKPATLEVAGKALGLAMLQGEGSAIAESALPTADQLNQRVLPHA